MTPYQQLVACSRDDENIAGNKIEFKTMEEYAAWYVKKFGTSPPTSDG